MLAGASMPLVASPVALSSSIDTGMFQLLFLELSVALYLTLIFPVPTTLPLGSSMILKFRLKSPQEACLVVTRNPSLQMLASGDIATLTGTVAGTATVFAAPLTHAASVAVPAAPTAQLLSGEKVTRSARTSGYAAASVLACGAGRAAAPGSSVAALA